MIAFFIENWGTVLVSLFVLAAIALIIRKMIKDRNNKGCNCGCSGCSMFDMCGKH